MVNYYLSCRELTPYNPVKEIVYKILMDSWWSPSGFMGSVTNWRSKSCHSGCYGWCCNGSNSLCIWWLHWRLKNASWHEITHGNLCCMHDCDRQKVAPSHTCAIHQNYWHQHIIRHGGNHCLDSSLIRRSEEEHVEWLPQRTWQLATTWWGWNFQKGRRTIILYLLIFIVWKPFVLHMMLCMLGHCLTNLNPQHKSWKFLEAAYPTPDVRPDYICIDKGCKVLCTAIVNGSWNVWKETSRFIVD